jgi:inositol-hexakisphosphate kinase
MQVYHTKSGVFKCHNKYYGRTLTVEGLKQEVCQFWDNGITFRFDLLLPCLAKLKALREIILKMNSYRFYSSSLLVIYDGDDSSSSVDVRMIDFEHSTRAGFRTDPSHDGVDQGYIMGLNSLIEILTDLHSHSSTNVNDVIASSSTPTLATSDTSSPTKSSAASTANVPENFLVGEMIPAN